MSNCNSNKNEALRDLVLLDSDSTNTFFGNESYVNKIKKAEFPLEIQANGGTMTVTQTCKIPFLGTHWFNKNAITNRISLADISNGYYVTMDAEKERIMIVHLKDKQV